MSDTPLRYAVLRHHQIAEPHYDILIETYSGSMLSTWRSAVWPIEQVISLQRVKDHRRIYLDYEGDLTERRGSVERVAGGNCQVKIGENAVWTVKLLNRPAILTLRQLSGKRWEARPGN